MTGAYPIKIGNSEYMVSGFGDRLGTPPSARGFNLKAFSIGLKKYETVYQATEENGYAFIIYADGDKKLILKGGQGSDHKETVLAGSKELQNIRKEKYADQNDMTFLRQTCLSGRAWLVELKQKRYYFVGIWNTSITPAQNSALQEYLTKFPKDATYIQMGHLGGDASSKFGLVGSFSPRISSGATKLSKKEKEFVNQAHMRTAELPAGYAKQLQKLKSMTETDDVWLADYKTYKKYQEYALKMIPKLEKIKMLGKAKTPAKDIVTQSAVTSIIIGLGQKFPELTHKLNSLLKYTFTHTELGKLHQRGKIDILNWTDPSMHGVLNEDLHLEQDLDEDLKSMIAALGLGAGAMFGGGDAQAAAAKVANTPKPAITQQAASTLDQSFVDYIKGVENAGKTGYNKAKKLWFPHKSFEGGSDTIGYGHKIQPGEDFSRGITDAHAEALLKKDLQKAQAQVSKELGGRRLTKKQMEMFVDFVFNMGTLKKFPLFTQAALSNDLAGMKAQYKRKAGGKELKGRNSAFLNRFLTEYFGFNYAIG